MSFIKAIRTDMEKKPHVLAVACPAQAHVRSFLQFCNKIAAQGIKVTFVNTDFIHSKITAAMAEKEKEKADGVLTLTSIPDGLQDLNDRIDPLKILDSLKKVMPNHLMDLIDKINQSNNGNEPITAVIADLTIGWILDVAEKIGAQQFGFWSSGPAALAFFQSLNLNHGAKGNNTENRQTNFPKEMLGSGSSGDQEKMQKVFLDIGIASLQTANRVKCILGNAFYELDSISCDLIPKFLPVGPFLNNRKQEICAKSGSFWPEDTSCLTWLDNQEPGSVIYVAFGSTGVVNQNQLDELALSLELSGRPFLWAFGTYLGNKAPSVFPNGFLERVGNQGKIVEWTDQHKVLDHRAVSCFLTHCGWNSALESVSLGVPLLCWPYFADHFQVQEHICELWKVGLRLDPDENGIRSKEEILKKIEMLLSDGNIKANALKLRELAQKSISKGGSSYLNMQKFIELLMN